MELGSGALSVVMSEVAVGLYRAGTCNPQQQRAKPQAVWLSSLRGVHLSQKLNRLCVIDSTQQDEEVRIAILPTVKLMVREFLPLVS